MKKLLLPLVAAAALAAPASAFAWGGGHGHHNGIHAGAFAGLTKLSGTGASFGGTTATASGTGFTASLATTWSSATSKTLHTMTFSCAPATASITLGTAAAASYTGRTCSSVRNGTTKYVFTGKASDGSHAVLGEDGTTVTGAVFKGAISLRMGAAFSKASSLPMNTFAAMKSGNCDQH
jgi:hypothetical protein